ncbi:tRNA pseudouridine synthase-like 1 isoform X1 [Apis dorsata]|uniref:tRNA pseudouridine synthase-like 1 isoform X1 n=2 Tax=Apis dorsata TaxID=7462 RepID=UPI001293F3EF|nr:tRNA pseudouridine synthase-like 1 isoform X1 [Apis dorsata]
MRRYFIKFSYLGTQYRGMQKNVIQDENIIIRDIDTIQGVLENAFTTLIPKCIEWPKITCSSRTDIGVHSMCNLAHIDIKNKYDSIYYPNDTLKFVNRYLLNCDHNIRLLEFIPVKKTFHVRKLVNSRTYLYRFLIAKNKDEHRIPVTELNQCFHVRSDTFDSERIKRATQLFMGTKDFRTFCSKSISNRSINYVRNLNSLTIEKGYPLMPNDPLSQNFEYWNIICSAKGFLYKQVRRIVGALIALGSDKITEKDISVMLQVPGHHNYLPQIQTAPSYGLYLMNVEYCHEKLNEYIVKYKISDNNTIIPLDTDEI